jgi:DNA-binding NarL/FixJ family response regulator
MRIVFADDSLLAREGVQHILADSPELELVAVCEDRDSLLAAVEEEQPDVVLTDVRMPPNRRDEGIVAANLLRQTHPEIGVIVLSQYAEPGYVVSLLEGGSARRGYLLKDRLADREQLVDAIRQVAAGGSVVDSKVVEALIAAHAGRESAPLDALTPREREILGQIAAGKSNAAIARTLVITKRAVEHHISSIFAKLDLPAESEVSRRVTATLVFLTETGSIAPLTPPE